MSLKGDLGFVKAGAAVKQVAAVEFGVASSEEVERTSVVQVVNRRLYGEPNTAPFALGPLDIRLGTSESSRTCGTCGEYSAVCPGHCGYIKLCLPAFHVGFFKHTLTLLQIICKACSRLLLPSPGLREKFLRLRRAGQLERRDDLFKRVVTECKKQDQCFYCKFENKKVKKIGLKIIHDRYSDKSSVHFAELKEKLQHMHTVRDVSGLLQRPVEELTPLITLRLFEAMDLEEIELVSMRKLHPKNLVLTHLLVPPVCIRPSVPVSEGMTNEDDLTIKLAEIVNLNEIIRKALDEGKELKDIFKEWEYMQAVICQYINSETPGLPPSLTSGKAIRALFQRLKGKHGRFRGNLSGKRVDFSGRTVISPDPNVAISQLVMPRQMAQIFTFPECVNRYNLEKLRELVRRGPFDYPGANEVRIKDSAYSLKFVNRQEIASILQVGDVVERHLVDGDCVLFNRQPSLHRISINAHRIKVMPGRTLRFNECVCTPYNADFDGDEMNVHVPQTYEAQADIQTLMRVDNNILTPKSGEPIIAPTQDFLTCAFLLTQKDVFYDRATFWRYVACFTDARQAVHIPPPAIVWPRELWTGKQLFSMLICPDSSMKINVQLEEKNYSKTGGCHCVRDGYVTVRNSELLTGNVGKLTIGGGSKKGLVFTLVKDYGGTAAEQFMSRVAKLSARWTMERGISLGISDVTPSIDLLTCKTRIIEDGYQQCQGSINQWKAGTLPLKPGCNAEQTLENVLNGQLSQLRENLGDLLRAQLDIYNSPYVMATCGSKGSNINLSQMIACVGQQTVSGNRIPDGFFSRSLPHFSKGSRVPAAKGFVSNSFYSGLTGSEFFFHTMGGREGLIDTAVKTAETGYMYRRLMKSLEDFSANYDYSVRSSDNHIAQFYYGDDGIEPMLTELEEKAINFGKLLEHIRATVKCAQALTPFDILQVTAQSVRGQTFFEQCLTQYLQQLAQDAAQLREQCGLDPCLTHAQRQPDNPREVQADLVTNLSELQLVTFITTCFEKVQRSRVTPGEAVGAVAAQSIGEPGTQMTLKTFHFAGVASMNITLGVPRIKEIINAVKDISTPIISAKLHNETEEMAAKIAKGTLEKKTVRDVALCMKEIYTPMGCYIHIKLNIEVISQLFLKITADSVKDAIINHGRLKLKDPHVSVQSYDKLRVYSPEQAKSSECFNLLELRNKLPHVIVSGISTIQRAVISINQTNKTFGLAIEGTGLKEVMRTPELDFRHCKTNHVMETEEVLGIEAARTTIVEEIKYTLREHGIYVDPRHIMLLADVMTFKGQVLGITRFGLCKMRDSPLMLASFEKTNDHLCDAAYRGDVDQILGVSEKIIMGKPVALGTGVCSLLLNYQECKSRVPRRRNRLLLA